jgi:hypothetical protein
MCQLLSSPPWVGLLFRIVEIKENAAEIPTQILALRLLTLTLPFGEMTSGQRTEIKDRLFSLVGHTALMCRFVFAINLVKLKRPTLPVKSCVHIVIVVENIL